VILDDRMKKCSRRISAVTFEQLQVKKQPRVEIYCGIQPRSFAVDSDSGFIDRNPLRLRRRRVRNAVGQPMNPLKDCLK
jgi:hypothetical protein